MRSLFFFIAVSLGLLASPQEPSAFEAGNLDSPNPYGLSATEKHILQNRQAIRRIEKSLLTQQQTVAQNRERIDAIQSLVEGLGERIRQIEVKLKGSHRIEEGLSELKAEQEKELEQIRTVLKEMGAMIDSINAKYVDKVRFEALEKSFVSFQKAYDRYQKSLRSKSTTFKGSKAKIFSQAIKLFRKKAYLGAKERFEYLIAHHYKPATSNFYLGEIAYYQGHYKEAVARYKKSASLYAKSKFMPVLLLHTAIALHRLGDKRQAKKFYQSVIDLYPKSSAAKFAKKRLSKIK